MNADVEIKIKEKHQNMIPLTQGRFDERLTTNKKAVEVQEMLNIALDILVENLNEQNTERQALSYHILKKQLQDAIKLAKNNWPGLIITKVKNGKFKVMIPLGKEKQESNTGFSHEQWRYEASATLRFLNNYVKIKQEDYKGLSEAIRLGDWDKTKQNFNQIWNEITFAQTHYSPYIRLKVLNIYAIGSSVADEYGIKPEEFSILDTLLNQELNSLEMAKQYTLIWLSELVRIVEPSQKSKDFNFAQKVTLFIEQNYYQDLKIQDVADHIHYSSHYVSRLFKKKIRCSFSGYLNQIRMAHARRLLMNTNLQIQEVAKRVGYKDSRYFSSVFRKNEGCTPSCYRYSLS